MGFRLQETLNSGNYLQSRYKAYQDDDWKLGARAANSKFWTNMKRVENLVDGGSLIQYSAFTTGSKRGAITVSRLVEHYGGEALLYRAEMIHLK